jgi:hypothetical protein
MFRKSICNFVFALPLSAAMLLTSCGGSGDTITGTYTGTMSSTNLTPPITGVATVTIASDNAITGSWRATRVDYPPVTFNLIGTADSNGTVTIKSYVDSVELLTMPGIAIASTNTLAGTFALFSGVAVGTYSLKK